MWNYLNLRDLNTVSDCVPSNPSTSEMPLGLPPWTASRKLPTSQCIHPSCRRLPVRRVRRVHACIAGRMNWYWRSTRSTVYWPVAIGEARDAWRWRWMVSKVLRWLRRRRDLLAETRRGAGGHLAYCALGW